MTTALRPGVQSRLRVQGQLAPGRPVDVQPRWGSDVTGSLHLEVDASGWVTDVRVDDLPDELRQTATLQSAVRAAIGDAMWAHVVAEAALVIDDATPEDVERGRDLAEGRARVRVPKVQSPPRTSADDLRDQAARRDRSLHVVDDRWTRRSKGASRDGEITVVMGWLEGFQSMTVDADWLRSTSASMLRYALREAFTAASDAGDDRA